MTCTVNLRIAILVHLMRMPMRGVIQYLATHPGAPCFDGFARSVVLRDLLVEVGKDVLGAVGGPEHQQPVVLLVGSFGVLSL